MNKDSLKSWAHGSAIDKAISTGSFSKGATQAHAMSVNARKLSQTATTKSEHMAAATAHLHAETFHSNAADEAMKAGNKDAFAMHQAAQFAHKDHADAHVVASRTAPKTAPKAKAAAAAPKGGSSEAAKSGGGGGDDMPRDEQGRFASK